MAHVAAVRDSGEATYQQCLPGTAYCWGSNSYGHIGDGKEKDQFVPARVRSLRGL